MATLMPYERVTGATRIKLAERLKRQYEQGRSIRELANEHGRAYSSVHQLLTEAGTALRGHGGPRNHGPHTRGHARDLRPK